MVAAIAILAAAVDGGIREGLPMSPGAGVADKRRQDAGAQSASSERRRSQEPGFAR
jgi:hypothetical protein